MANILVFLEQRGGRVKKAALETLSEGRRLADASGGTCLAVCVGGDPAEVGSIAGKHGADELHHAANAGDEGYAPERYRDALLAAITNIDPDAVLFPASAMGLDVAATVAARLDVGCLSDVVELAWQEDGLQGRRPVYAGKAFATARLSTRPALATLRPNVFTLTESGKAGTVVELALADAPLRARAVRVEQGTGLALDVAEADIVVAGGRGLKGPEHFALLRQLAEVLGAAVGASRAAVDAGWIEHAHQVGQTGKTVAPKLYIACGISGAIQHLAGMSSSKVIVAINKDPDAPIFKHASYGIVGDLFEVVPALTDALRAYQKLHA